MTRRRKKRQKFRPAVCGCLAVLMFASGCKQQTPEDTRAADERTIRDLDAQWSQTAAAHDLEGTVSYYSDDAVLLPPNAHMATDKQAIRASWASILIPSASVSWRISRIEVSRSGDLAYLVGTYALTLKDPQGKPVMDRGKLIEAWKKQADGKWKTVADTYNSDLKPSAT
jgi:uncharacterized protein (TIGR02246 family)